MRSARCLRTVGALAIALTGCLTGNDVTRAPPISTRAASQALIVPAPLASGRLPGTARPLKYTVSLAIDPVKDRFLGDVAIQVDVPATTQAIVLHGRDLQIIRAEVSVNGDSLTATTSSRSSSGLKDSPDELVLELVHPIAAGKAEIRIAYSAALSDKLSGLYRVREGGDSYAFTQFEPTDARRMMPCFDEPAYKVPFDLKVTSPKGNLVVANTNEVERVDSDDGRSTTFRFATTPPLPTYLFALAVGPLEIRDGSASPVKIRLITTKGKSKLGELALEAAEAQVKLLGEYFDRAYPYPKLDLLAVPEFGFGAMENAGLITFREELILLDSKSAATEARRAMATNVAHEISHHWFGNLVTIAWWDDLWLNEGFATWMESKIVDTWRPQMNARLESLTAKGAVMADDALQTSRAIRQPVRTTSEAEESFDSITYDKGSAVLGMLEAWLGPDVFRDGVRGYVKAHEHGSATAADLFSSLSKSAKKDVWPVASTFLDQPGVPLVRAELVCDKTDARVKLAQSRYRSRMSKDAEAHDSVWKIPICIAYEGSDRSGPACGMLDGPEGEITIKGHCPRWVYPNAEEHGYYRFALPSAQMSALAGAGRALPLAARIGLLSDAWALVQSGDMPADALLDLVAGMRHERQRLVVEAVIDTLRKVSNELVGDDLRPAFRSYVSAILLPIGKELGWDAKKGDSDDQKLLRRSVLTALETLADDPWLVPEAERHAIAYLKDPRSIDADIAQIALRASSRHSADKRWGDLVQAMKKPQLPEDRIVIVGALGSFASTALLRRSLDLMLSDQIKIQDSFAIFEGAMTLPESRSQVIAWVKEHFGELRGKMPDFALTRLTGAFSTVCDASGRAEAAGLYAELSKSTEGGERAFQQALETIDLCIDLRAREGARAKKRLSR